VLGGDRKQQVELVVIAVGLVVFVGVLHTNLKGAKKKLSPKVAVESVPSAEKAPAAVPAADAPASRPKDLLKKQQEAFERPLGRDPFALPSADRKISGTGSMLLILKGVSIKAGSEPLALIDRAIVRKGDTVGGAKVVEIGGNYVILEKGGRKLRLELEKGR